MSAWKHPPRPRPRFDWRSLAPLLLLAIAVGMAGIAAKAVGQFEYDLRQTQ